MGLLFDTCSMGCFLCQYPNEFLNELNRHWTRSNAHGNSSRGPSGKKQIVHGELTMSTCAWRSKASKVMYVVEYIHLSSCCSPFGQQEWANASAPSHRVFA